MQGEPERAEPAWAQARSMLPPGGGEDLWGAIAVFSGAESTSQAVAVQEAREVVQRRSETAA
jgi:hypothetical protein